MPKFTPTVNEITQRVLKLLRKYTQFCAVSENITPPRKIPLVTTNINLTFCHQSLVKYHVIRAQCRNMLWMFERKKNKHKTWGSVFWETQRRNRDRHNLTESLRFQECWKLQLFDEPVQYNAKNFLQGYHHSPFHPGGYPNYNKFLRSRYSHLNLIFWNNQLFCSSVKRLF